MSTHAERYAAARERSGDRRTGLADFEIRCGFPLDRFQIDACRAVAEGRNVVVSAPTGSGKTVVAEFAADRCRANGARLFYTTPIKALSNQKFQELRDTHGEGAVGLLTGDNSVNSEADLVVMTTEVLRNMIYSKSSDLADLATVVMDEVHYLADRSRGPVWEETIIHLPAHVQVIALSATVSNAEELAAWISSIRGKTTTVTESHRPVPLHQHILHEGHMHDLLTETGRLNPELSTLHKQLRERLRMMQGGGHTRRNQHARLRRPSRVELVETLAATGLLPAIQFIFSRNACDAAVEQCLEGRVRLTSNTERLRIREYVEERCRTIADSDLAVLGYLRWREALENGIAAHHAGLIPVFKETVEGLFQQGLIKVVFATETLALGINMPAKSVILERLVIWNGDPHVPINAADYTQLTGRAGRRGIDDEGHAVVLMSDDLDLNALGTMATMPSFPLRSAFSASYNMVVNLINSYGFSEARRFNSLSFAQFQSDQSHIGLTTTIADNDEAQVSLATQIECHLGDFDVYAKAAAELSKLEKSTHAQSRNAANAALNICLENLRVGDVVRVSRGRRRGLVLVVGAAKVHPPRLAVLGIDKHVRRVSAADFSLPPQILGHIAIRPGFDQRSANARKSLANQLANLDVVNDEGDPAASGEGRPVTDEAIDRMRSHLRSHPCHGCSDRKVHMAAWHENHRLKRESDALTAKIEGRRTALARRFDALCRVLSELGYLDAGDDLGVTSRGLLLAGVHTELDLVATEVLTSGALDHVQPATAAAVAAALVYESRQDEQQAIVLPSAEVRETMLALHRAWAKVTAVEAEHRVQPSRPLDYSMVPSVYRWATGQNLTQVIHGQTFSPGDFVRAVRQCIDVLRQMAAVTGLAPTAKSSIRAAAALLDRDIVSATVMEDV